MSRFLLAVHESGHAVAAVLLGHEVTAVTIELDGGFRGVVFNRPREPFSIADSDDFSSIFRAPTGARIALERRLAVTLAGPLAEEAYGDDPPVGYVPLDRDEEHVRRVVLRRLSEMPAETRALLAEEESNPEGAADLARSNRLAGLCSSRDVFADRFLAWFRLEVDAWVRSQQFRRPLERVVVALLEHGELAGHEVEALVNATAANGGPLRAAGMHASACPSRK